MKKWRQTDKAKASKKLSAKRRYLRHKEKIDRANANYRLVKNYGITLDQRTAMLAGQNGMCALCGEVLGEKKHTAIDHCHKTGKVRGILHRMCNVLIGTAHEREELLQKAIDYLRRHA